MSKAEKQGSSLGALLIAGLVIGAAVAYIATDESRRNTALSCVKEGADKAVVYAKKAKTVANEVLELLPWKTKLEANREENNPWQEVDLFLNENK